MIRLKCKSILVKILTDECNEYHHSVIILYMYINTLQMTISEIIATFLSFKFSEMNDRKIVIDDDVINNQMEIK